jgi:hypothetical protein
MGKNAKQNNASNSTLEPRSFCESLRHSTTTRWKSLRAALKQRLHVRRDGWMGFMAPCLDSGNTMSRAQNLLARRGGGLTGLCVSTLYNFMGNGRLQTIKVGGRRLVTREALDALLGASGTDVTTRLPG